MHCDEELQFIRQEIQHEYNIHTDLMQTNIPTSTSTNHGNPFQVVNHGTMIYTLYRFYYTPPNEPIVVPTYHPITIHNFEQSLMDNMAKLGKTFSKDFSCKGKNKMVDIFDYSR